MEKSHGGGGVGATAAPPWPPGRAPRPGLQAATVTQPVSELSPQSAAQTVSS